MVDETTISGTQGPGPESSGSQDTAPPAKELSESVADMTDAVSAQAKDLGERAMGRLGSEAEEVRDQATAGLSAFSDALKSASEQLSGHQQSLAGDVVSQAAGGLEQLSRWLDGKSPREMIDGMRSFGRQNPVAFAAGSVLAGFALGRLVAAMPESGEPGRSSGEGN